MSLNRKLLLAFLLLAIVPLAAVIAIFQLSFAPQAERMVGERLQDSAAQTVRAVDNFMLTCLRDFKALAEAEELVEDLPATMSARLVRHTYAYPYFRQVLLTDTNAVVIGSSATGETGMPLFALHDELRDDFQIVLQRPPGLAQVSALSDVSAITPHLDLHLLLRVQDAAGRPRGVLVAAIELQYLRELIEDLDQRTPGDEHAYLLDREGRVLLTADPEAKPLSVHHDAESVARRQQATNLREGWVAGVDDRGDHVMDAFAVTSGFGANQAGRWLVVTCAPRAVVMAPVRRVNNEALALLGVALLVATGLALWMARGLTRPLLQLTRGVHALAAGDLSARVPETGRDETGQLAAAFNRMTEALQKRTAELRASEEQFRQLAETITEVFYVEDLEPHRIAYLSPAFETVWGVPCAQAMAQPDAWTQFIHPEDRERIVRAAGEFFRSVKTEYEHEFRIVRPDGKVRWIHDRAFALGDATGRRHRVVGVASDITARKQAEEALHRFNTELEQRVVERTADLSRTNEELRVAKDTAEMANAAKSEFLSRMSHELRTPLNAILGFAQLLEMNPLTDPQKSSVGQILKGGRHLLGLINDVLDLARIESGRLTLSPEPVRVRQVVGEALDLVRPAADRRRIALAADWTAPGDWHVRADHQRLKQVLLNLLINAVQYNQEGGKVTVTAEIRGQKSEDSLPCAGLAKQGGQAVSPGVGGAGTPAAESAPAIPLPPSGSENPKSKIENRSLRIAIADTGPGIAPEEQADLFKPFERAGARHAGLPGTGLGLAFCRRLVELMGGTIGVQSTAGQGSTFWVEFPLADKPQPQLPLLAAPSTPAPAPPVKTKTLLYVEDNLANLQLLESILAHRPGVRLVTAMQGRLTLELAHAQQPAVILLDIHLPDMPGDEVLRLLREDTATRDIPVLMLSADATPRQVKRLLALGARAYLTKPIDVEPFLRRLDELLA